MRLDLNWDFDLDYNLGIVESSSSWNDLTLWGPILEKRKGSEESEKVKTFVLTLISKCCTNLHEDKQSLQEFQKALHPHLNLGELSQLVVKINRVSSNLQKIDRFAGSKLLQELNSSPDGLKPDQLKAQQLLVQAHLDAICSELIPHLRIAVQERKSSQEIEALLKTLVNIKKEASHFNESPELRRLFGEYKLLNPPKYIEQCKNIDPGLVSRLLDLPLLFQNSYLEFVKFSSIQAYEKVNAALEYLEALAELENREFLLLLDQNTGYLPERDTLLNTWRVRLLQLWTSNAQELVKEILKNDRGHTQNSHPYRMHTQISSFIFNYFEQQSSESTTDPVKVSCDFAQLNEMADALPQPFFSNWIMDVEGLFEFWNSQKKSLLAFANSPAAIKPFDFSSIKTSVPALKMLSPRLNMLIAVFRQDADLAKQLTYLATSSIPQAAQLGSTLLEKLTVKQIQAVIPLIEQLEHHTGNNSNQAYIACNRFLAFYTHSPKLALPLTSLSSYPLLIENVLKKRISALEITQQDIQEAFEESGLSKLYKKTYKISNSEEPPLIQKARDSEEFLKRMEHWISTNYTLVPLVSTPDQLRAFLTQLPIQERAFYDSLGQLPLQEALRLLKFLGEEHSLRVGIKLLELLPLFEEKEAFFRFLTSNRSQLADLLDFHRVNDSEPFKKLVEVADSLGQKKVTLLITNFAHPLSQSLVKLAKFSPKLIEPWLNAMQSAECNIHLRNFTDIFEEINLQTLKEMTLNPHRLPEYAQVIKKLTSSKFVNSLPSNPNLLKLGLLLSDLNDLEDLLRKTVEEPEWARVLTELPLNDHRSKKIAMRLAAYRTELNDAPNRQELARQEEAYMGLFRAHFDRMYKLADLYLAGYQREFDQLMTIQAHEQAVLSLQDRIFAHSLDHADSNRGEFLKRARTLDVSKDRDLLEFIAHESAQTNHLDISTQLLALHSKQNYTLLNKLLSLLAAPSEPRTPVQQLALDFLKKEAFTALESLLDGTKLLWEDLHTSLTIRETLLDLQRTPLSLPIQNGVRNLLSAGESESVTAKKLGMLQYLLGHNPETLERIEAERYPEDLEKIYNASSLHPKKIFKQKWMAFEAETFPNAAAKEAAAETLISCYLSSRLLTASGGINSFIREVLLESVSQESGIPPDSSFFIYLRFVLDDIYAHNAEYNSLFYSIKLPQEGVPSRQLIQELTNSSHNITIKQAREAILGALLTRIRQGAIGSCFGTQTAINTQSYHQGLLAALDDYKHLVCKGVIPKTTHKSYIEYPIVMIPKEALMGHPLARAREYTIAQMASTTSTVISGLELLFCAFRLDDGRDVLVRRFKNILKQSHGFDLDGDVGKRFDLSDVFTLALKKITKAIYQPEKISKYGEKGAWVLLSRTTEALVDTPEKYQKLILEILMLFQQDLQKAVKFSDQEKKMFTEGVGLLIKEIKGEIKTEPSFLLETLSRDEDSKSLSDPILHYQSLKRLPWISFDGGTAEKVQSNYYLEHNIQTPLTIRFGNPEDLLQDLSEMTSNLHEWQKTFIRNNPNALIPVITDEHCWNIKLQGILGLVDCNKSVVATLKKEVKRLLLVSISQQTKEKIYMALANAWPPFSERECKHLEEKMRAATQEASTLQEVCSHCRALLIDYMGRSYTIDYESQFEVKLVEALRSEGIEVPKPLAVMDTNWKTIGYANCYVGFRASLLSGNIMRFMHSDSLKGETALWDSDYPCSDKWGTSWRIKTAVFR